MSAPTTMQAYVIRSRSMFWPLQAAVSKYANEADLVSRPVPTPKSDQLLVKINAFAANPTDVLHIDYVGVAGSIIGCDFVGTVVSSGSPSNKHKEGDRVFGLVHGGKYRDIGSAAEYCVIDDELAMDIPKGMPDEDAVTFGVSFVTAAAVLYDSQKVSLPPAKVTGSPWYLVSGGSTAAGLFVIQLARLAGFRVIATASPRSFDLVKNYGADHVVSYADLPAAIKQIQEITGGGVTIGMDCVGGKENLRFAVNAFGPDGGKITSILPGGKSHRQDVQLEDILLYRYLGKAFSFIPIVASFPAEPEKRAFLTGLTAKATSLIEENAIKPNPVEVTHGLEALPGNWDRLRNKKVSGAKLVTVIA